jgi:large subunit ribosomal protein L15
MALNGSRSLVSSYSRALRQCRCPSTGPTYLRPFSSSSRRAAETTSADEALEHDRPRWSYTPERMKGPGFSINVVKDPRRKIWSVNQDPKKLDAMYSRLLGPGGDRLLPDEIKWLAVTHKSFDHGRRGYNTKLAYFGTLLLLSATVTPSRLS